MHFVNQSKSITQPTFINLYPNEYCQELHYYPFTVKLNGCVWSCDSLNDLW